MTANKYRDHIIVSCALGCQIMISALKLQANNIRSPLKSAIGIASLSLCHTVHVHVHTGRESFRCTRCKKKKKVSPYDRRIARRNSKLSCEVANKLMFLRIPYSGSFCGCLYVQQSPSKLLTQPITAHLFGVARYALLWMLLYCQPNS